MKKRHLSYLLPVIGIVLIAHFIDKLGWDKLLSALDQMGAKIAILFILPLFLFFVHTLGWRHTMSERNQREIGLFRLTLLQTFAYGISTILPMQAMLAEPIKLGFLAGTDYDKEDFTASLLIDNTINALSIFVVSSSSLLYLAVFMDPGRLIQAILVGCVLAFALLFVVLLKLQTHGVFSGVVWLLVRWRVTRKFAESKKAQAERVDDCIRTFYRSNRRGFYMSLFYHILEKAQGVAEFWVIFWALGVDVSIGKCFFIFGVVNALDNLLFFVQVGGMEVWISSLLQWMQLTRDGLNVTAALFRRIRMLFWVVVAVALILPLRWLFVQPSEASAEPTS